MRHHVWIPVVLLLIAPAVSQLNAQQNPQHIRINRAIESLAQGRPIFGLSISNRSVDTGKMLRSSGLDFFVIDMEHEVYDFPAVQDLLLGLREQPFSQAFIEAAKAAFPDVAVPPPTPMVKIGRLGREQIEFDVRHALKLGALGVFIPYTESKEEIALAVRAATKPESQYVPGLSDQDWEQRNGPWPLNPQGEFLIGAMIESTKGEEHIEEILNTPGLGAVWIAHPSSEAVGRKILQMCKDRGIVAACSDYNTDHFKARLDEGYNMVFLGWDSMMFFRGLNEVLNIAKQAVDSRK